jgi:hypothetical protein
MDKERQQSGASPHPPQPIRGDEGATLIGPTNPAREAQSPSRLAPPQTDHGTLPSLKWSFADSHNRLQPGGWARQTTVRELPIATELAGVNMRLKAGAIREMHWHTEAVGLHAQGPGADHLRRSKPLRLPGRRWGGRGVELPGRHSALHPGARG